MKTENYKLPKQIKTRWISALRSGKYIQGKHNLRKYSQINQYHAYCCLGVLGKLCGFPNNVLDKNEYLYNIDNALLPDGCQMPAFFKNKALSKTLQTELAKMNDEESYSFEQIADYIEKNL